MIRPRRIWETWELRAVRYGWELCRRRGWGHWPAAQWIAERLGGGGRRSAQTVYQLLRRLEWRL